MYAFQLVVVLVLAVLIFLHFLTKRSGIEKSSSVVKGLSCIPAPGTVPPTAPVPPRPGELTKLADDYDAKQLQISIGQHELFNAAGHSDFLHWIDSLVQREASLGGRMLTLNFYQELGLAKIDADGVGLLSQDRAADVDLPDLEQLLPTYTLPLPASFKSTDLLRTIAADVAERFRMADFDVHLMRYESVPLRGKRYSPEFTSINIQWVGPPSPQAEVLNSICGSCDSVALPHQEASYQTVPLTEYSLIFQQRAAKLFKEIQDRVGRQKAKTHTGSYSVSSAIGKQTALKIIIYETGRGNLTRHSPPWADGVYVLVRTSGLAGERIWSKRLDFLSQIDRIVTVGIAPNHSDRFGYFKVSEQKDDGPLIDFMEKCAKA